jgi:hypothetical protein
MKLFMPLSFIGLTPELLNAQCQYEGALYKQKSRNCLVGQGLWINGVTLSVRSLKKYTI